MTGDKLHRWAGQVLFLHREWWAYAKCCQRWWWRHTQLWHLRGCWMACARMCNICKNNYTLKLDIWQIKLHGLLKLTARQNIIAHKNATLRNTHLLQSKMKESHRYHCGCWNGLLWDVDYVVLAVVGLRLFREQKWTGYINTVVHSSSDSDSGTFMLPAQREINLWEERGFLLEGQPLYLPAVSSIVTKQTQGCAGQHFK